MMLVRRLEWNREEKSTPDQDRLEQRRDHKENKKKIARKGREEKRIEKKHSEIEEKSKDKKSKHNIHRMLQLYFKE